MNKDKLLKLAVQEVKNYVFNENRRFLCHCLFCPMDGYCPTYDCGWLSFYKRLTDRQWENAIKPHLDKYFPYDIERMANVAGCVLHDLRFRREAERKE